MSIIIIIIIIIKQGQSRTQSLVAFWSAAKRQQVLWENAICIPRKFGNPILVRMFQFKTEVEMVLDEA